MAVHQGFRAMGTEGPRLPEDLPDDLKWHLADALSYASCTPQDIWETVRDWMIRNGMARPGEPAAAEGPRGSTKFGAPRRD